MAETAAFLVDEVFPRVPIPLRYWMAANPKLLTSVLTIVTRGVSGYLKSRVAIKGGTKEAGIVTLVQRFGGSVNLNIHFHMLVLDGVYVTTPDGVTYFYELDPPSNQEVVKLLVTVQERIIRHLIKKGYLASQGSIAEDQPELFTESEAMSAEAMSASVQSKSAWGERAGERVRRAEWSLGLPADEPKPMGQRCAEGEDFLFMPILESKATSGIVWNDYAGMCPDPRLQTNGCP